MSSEKILDNLQWYSFTCCPYQCLALNASTRNNYVPVWQQTQSGHPLWTPCPQGYSPAQYSPLLVSGALIFLNEEVQPSKAKLM